MATLPVPLTSICSQRIVLFRRFRAFRSVQKFCRLISSKVEHNNDLNKKISIEYGEELRRLGLGRKLLADEKIVNPVDNDSSVPYLPKSLYDGFKRKVYFETYGCQMNVNDVQIASTILQENGFIPTKSISEADVIFLVTCSVREGAEDKIWRRLIYLRKLKKDRKSFPGSTPLKVGVLGCMVSRLKEQIFEKEALVDLICGPDSYKDLPRLLSISGSGQNAANVQLSLDETYADVIPVRTNEDSRSAFISIMRGCDNMCTYCIVPFTRGRERSRPISSIIEEVKVLSDQGVKEITLLGQNVNSYRDMSESSSYGGFDNKSPTNLSSTGFKTVYKTKIGGRRFSDLLDQVSAVDPEIRIRFTSPHPKDFPLEVLQMIKERNNICNQIHLPAQSGNNQVLEDMGRGYTRETYLELVHQIRQIIPDVALSSDFIAGFCGETEQAHQDSISLIQEVRYNFVYCFPYSMRQKTRAYRRLEDNVPKDVKLQRSAELAQVFRAETLKLNMQAIGSQQLILIEGESKRSVKDMAGRNESNTKVIVPNVDIPSRYNSLTERNLKPGDYVVAQILSCSSQVLKGVPLYHTTLQDFYKKSDEYMCDVAG